MNKTRTLAEFVARLRYEDLPRAVCGIVIAAILVLSGFSCARDG